ncbi:MAG TPA: glycosyltransferase [Chthoniobacterales bacterium]
MFFKIQRVQEVAGPVRLVAGDIHCLRLDSDYSLIVWKEQGRDLIVLASSVVQLMRLSIFGLTLSSSWGNGHATLWRGLCRGLAERGHEITFFERDVPYYAEHRDLQHWAHGKLVLYRNWEEVRSSAQECLTSSDAVIVTSFCVDANVALGLAEPIGHLRKVFYDMDTPVSLQSMSLGKPVPYLPEDGLGRYDLVLSFTGGPVIDALKQTLGAKRVEVLYGHADPAVHRPEKGREAYRSNLSYLGTYAADRQPALERMLVEPAAQQPEKKFLLVGSLYPSSFPWQPNLYFIPHLPPAEHPAFFSSSDLTLNVTREAMAANGYCPSGRLFEAAACGTPVISDVWEGLAQFFVPGQEIFLARDTTDVLRTLSFPSDELYQVGKAARTRFLEEHTSQARARDLERFLCA